MNAVKPRWEDYYEGIDCGRCGGPLEESFSYCPYCGAEVDWGGDDPLYDERRAVWQKGAHDAVFD